MSHVMRPHPLVTSFLAFILIAGAAQASDIRISLPKRTKPTPVQKLNQDGVKAIKKHKLDEASKLFYKAYLLDPDDPFTLNNLGYLSELNGDLERAQRYYELAAENTSDATIDRSTLEDFKGKKVSEVAGRAADLQMQVNRYNVQAMGLLQKDRAPEADLVLEKALRLDPRNPFTLNNLGFAKEKEGEYEKAFAFYSKAANTGSHEPVIVALNKKWRGKAISDVAKDNTKAVRKLMEGEDNNEAKVARLNLQGVSAMNRNDHTAARDYFRRAYRLAPNDAFTLNNMGFLAEMDGDRETADFYYTKAQDADRSKAIAAVATRKNVEGKPIRTVAEYGGTRIEERMEVERAERARLGGPVLLKKRDGTVVVEPDRPPEPLPDETPAPSNPATEMLQPLPSDQQPPAVQPEPQMLPPLPDNQQPTAKPGDILQPLPDSQQPVNTKPGDVLPPLPDSQQPTTKPPKPPKK